MQHDRLKLVVPDEGANATTDTTTDRLEIPTTPDPGVRRLRVVDADEGPPPDDAA
jgi:hypothetical protein